MNGEPEPPEEGVAPLLDAAAPVQEGVLAAVAVARAALDVLEKVARDPSPLVEVANRAARVGREAAVTWASATVGDPGAADPPEDGDGMPPRRPRVERISVDPEPEDVE